MRHVRVKVTEEHINWNNHGASTCPIALAFRDIGYEALVTKNYIAIKQKHNRGWESGIERYVFYRMPPLIGNWVETFDLNTDDKVLPIEFTLNLDNHFDYLNGEMY